MKCGICPRGCAQRETGLCGVGMVPVVARAAPHFDEEPVISGTRGSGAVFFSGCPLGCVYCQNEELSFQRAGKPVRNLRAIYERLIAQGVHNINLVTAGHFLPAVAESLRPRLPVPVVWNSSGYESEAQIAALGGLGDVYRPDFKYLRGETAAALSHCPDYPQVAKRALLAMHAQVGEAVFDEEGLMRRGLLVRHLILPGHAQESVEILGWIFENLPHAYVSVMAQYTPNARVAGTPLDRRISRAEYEHVWRFIQARGFENGFVQSRASARREYTPAFDLTGVDDVL